MAKVFKSIKRTYSVGPYETLHVETAIERECDDNDEAICDMSNKVEKMVMDDFVSYRNHIYEVIEGKTMVENHNSEIKDVRDNDKNSDFQKSFLRD
jgi:hypothetical protein